ncbi:TatA/E family protein of Tat protein translocase [Tamaricihabitans halophyticus]|uniref:Sec-independent protein translocase protein TatA n=1 Tax=Tamaricihabitans halophyticus TaxID=1262583 RepID=A0A4R2QGV0_9PSEU|nr:Sec-independent protein translocase subunit TatA [Tamaricihabitans halophyticus]TCP46291.1 TatA/E family protein of Tat protein translocase [Tamaricihabitans halophyticus]
MGSIGPAHIIIVLVAFVLLFGAKKLPDMARSVGQSMRIFKAETTQLKDDKSADVQSQQAQQASNVEDAEIVDSDGDTRRSTTGTN